MTQPLSQAYLDAINGAPEIVTSPDLVAAAAQSPDPASSAQVLAHTTDMLGMTQAVQHVATHHSSLLGSLMGDLGNAVSSTADAIGGAASSLLDFASPVLNVMNKPLQDVQHDYRFLHDMWTKSDPISATLATLGVVGGAALGAWGGGFSGAVLGADLVASGEAHLAGSGALNAVNPRYQQLYRNSTGEKISPGRDLAHLLGLGSTDSGAGQLVSGLADATFDFTMDPVAKGLSAISKGQRTATGLLDSTAAARSGMIRNALLNHGLGGIGLVDSPDIGVDAATRLDAARNSLLPGMKSPYERALSTIADTIKTGGTGKFQQTFPELSRMTGLLDGATTADKVHEVFRGQLTASELERGYAMLPTRSMLRAVTSPLTQGIRNLGPQLTEQTPEAAAELASKRGGLLSALNPASDTTLGGAVQQKIGRFTGYLPFAIDRSSPDGKQLLNLSKKSFDLMDPGSLQGMQRSLSYALPTKTVQAAIHDIAAAQITGNEALVRTIWTNAQKTMLLAAGLPDDPTLIKQVSDAVGDASATSRAFTISPDNNYIRTTSLHVPTDANDTRQALEAPVPAAMYGSQTSTLSTYPDFQQITNTVRSMTRTGRALGGFDEAMNRLYTRNLFKPLALVNMGFGLRVAAAEALPAAFRYGALNMIQNRIAASVAKHDYQVQAKSTQLLNLANKARESGDMESFVTLTKQAQNSEVGHLSAAVGHMLGGMTKLARVDDRTLDIATRIATDFDGHLVTGVGRAGEDMHREALNPTDRNIARLWFTGNARAGNLATGNWTWFSPDRTDYADLWHGHLNTIANSEPGPLIADDLKNLLWTHRDNPEEAIRQATIREANRIKGLTTGGTPMPEGETPFYMRERATMMRYNAQDPNEFAAARVRDVRDALTGRDGTFHADLAEHVADGQVPFDAVQQIPWEQGPKAVPGQETIPALPTSPYNMIVQQGFQRLVDPIINGISREPLFLAAVKEQLPPLERMVDLGIIDKNQAYREAYYRATEALLPQIHNVELRSQFAQIMRNVLPFYFAQEQAIRRVVHAGGKNLATYRDYQLVENALTNPSWVHTDSSGASSVVIPFAGGLGTHLLNGLAGLGIPVQAGLPLTFTGATSSLKTVLPELQPPGVSPLVSVPLNELAKFFPEWSPAVKQVVGDRGFQANLSQELIPNSLLRNTFLAASGDTNNRQFANAMVSAITAAAYHGQLPPPDATPAVRQAFLDRIKNNARSIFMMKGILATFSPLSPEPVPEDFGLRDEFYNLLQKKGMTYPQAIQAFLAKHGQAAISYTVAKSENTSGALIPSSSQAALDFINNNHDLITNHLSAAYFVPETSDTSGTAQVIHNELVNMGLRAVDTPSQFLDQMYIKAGDQYYRLAKQAHTDRLAQATSSDQVQAETQAWSDLVNQMKSVNPIWAADFTSENRLLRAHQIYTDMVTLFSKNLAPQSSQTAGIEALMRDYTTHQANLTFGDVTAQKQAWSDYLASVAKDHPELANVIDNVFARLDRRI